MKCNLNNIFMFLNNIFMFFFLFLLFLGIVYSYYIYFVVVLLHNRLYCLLIIVKCIKAPPPIEHRQHPPNTTHLDIYFLINIGAVLCLFICRYIVILNIICCRIIDRPNSFYEGSFNLDHNSVNSTKL